jgi:ABC-2 type transport system permease protein
MNTSRVIAAYASDIRFEFLKMLRTPAFAVPTLVFPAMFYLLFGVLMNRGGDATVALHTFARLGIFGTMAPGLFGFGVSLAFEREYGTLTYKQALPMPHGSYLLARMVMAMLFASIIATLLIVMAFTIAHAPLTAAQAARVFVIEVLGVLPFCAVGLMVGASVSGQAAPAIVNVIYLPMAFLSGLWVPLQFLPKIIQDTAAIWPSFHLSQLGLHALGLESMGTTPSHVAALIGVTVLCFTIAMRRLGNSGLRLLGGTSATSGKPAPLRRIAAMAVMWVSIGLIIVGVMGGKTKVAAPAATDAAATESVAAASPVGIPAPPDVLLGDFDAGSDKAPYGDGWNAGGDRDRDGDSTASQRVVGGALEVSGVVGGKLEYPFAGTAFFPAGYAGGRFMDYSGKHTLSFRVRGDGRQYKVLFLAGVQVDTYPPSQTFTAGAQWQTVSVDLDGMGGLDRQRVRGIVIGSMGPAGDFRLEIDDIELR